LRLVVKGGGHSYLGASNELGGFQFAAVKVALVATFAVAEGDQSRFFARLEHWRRVGAIEERPGKGTRAAYSAAQIDKLTFLIQMSRFSIEPNLTVELIKAQWDPPRRRDLGVAMQRGEASISELFTSARAARRNPNAVSYDVYVTIQIDDFVSKGRLPRVGFFTGHPKSKEGFYHWLGQGQNSACVFNLTERLQALDTALAALPRPPLPPGEAGEILKAGARAARKGVRV
jgi:hypothetical protein